MADPHQEHDLADACRRRRRASMTGFGMRAKRENSSTMRLMSSTCRMIVSVHCVEDRRVVGDHLAVFAAQALGRELDRRQRVLDLVGDAPRHVGPGRRALRGDEIGDVVERDDIAILVFGGADCSLVTRTEDCARGRCG